MHSKSISCPLTFFFLNKICPSCFGSSSMASPSSSGADKCMVAGVDDGVAATIWRVDAFPGVVGSCLAAGSACCIAAFAGGACR